MHKWESIAITLNGNKAWIDPAKSFAVDWLKQRYPQAKISIEKSAYRAVAEFRSYDECAEAYYTLIEHLGSSGWEPFAAEGSRLWLKRSSQQP